MNLWRKVARNFAAGVALANVLALIAFGWIRALTGGTWIVEDVGAFMLVTMESVVTFGAIAGALSVSLDE